MHEHVKYTSVSTWEGALWAGGSVLQLTPWTGLELWQHVDRHEEDVCRGVATRPGRERGGGDKREQSRRGSADRIS